MANDNTRFLIFHLENVFANYLLKKLQDKMQLLNDVQPPSEQLAL